MLTGFPSEKPRGIGVAYPDFTGPHFMVGSGYSAHFGVAAKAMEAKSSP